MDSASSTSTTRIIIILLILLEIPIYLDHINNKAQELNIIEDRHTLFVMHNKANSDYDSLLFQYMIQSNYAMILDTEAQKLEIEENTSEDDDDNDLSFWRSTGDLDSQTYRDSMISELENAKN